MDLLWKVSVYLLTILGSFVLAILKYFVIVIVVVLTLRWLGDAV